MRVGAALCCVGLALVAGLVAGRSTAPSASGTDAAELAALHRRLDDLARAAAFGGRGTCAVTVDGASIQAELMRAVAAACPAEARAAAGVDAPPPRLDAEAAARAAGSLAQGRSMIRQAVARGLWGEEQASALRALLGDLDDEGRAELMAALLPAINEGRLRIATEGPPL